MYVKLLFEEVNEGVRKEEVKSYKVVTQITGFTPAEIGKGFKEAGGIIVSGKCSTALNKIKIINKVVGKLSKLLEVTPDFVKKVLTKVGNFLDSICTKLKELVKKHRLSSALIGSFITFVVGAAIIAAKFKLNLKKIFTVDFWKEVVNKAKSDKKFLAALAIVAALSIISFGVIYYFLGKISSKKYVDIAIQLQNKLNNETEKKKIKELDPFKINEIVENWLKK